MVIGCLTLFLMCCCTPYHIRNARMELTTAVSKVVGDKQRLKNIKTKYTAERLAKQLTIMKYVREQMRHSDVCVVIEDISRRAREHMRLLNMNAELTAQTAANTKAAAAATSVGTASTGGESAATAAAAAAATIDRMKTMLSHFIGVSNELRTAAAPSSGKPAAGKGDVDVPVGAMELRLQDSEVDDETLNGILGLLYSGTANATSGKDGTYVHTENKLNRFGRLSS